MSSTIPPGEITWKEWLLFLLLHCLILAVGSMTLGLAAEAAWGNYWLNTGLDGYSPMIALVALLSGYFVVSQGQSRHAAPWMWTVGTVWLAFGIFDTAWGPDAWNATWSPEKTRLAHVIANLFGPTDRCNSSECLTEIIFTTPFTASVMYSIGAYIKIRRLANRSQTSKDFSL